MADDTLCIGDVVCLYSVESKGYVLAAHHSSAHNVISVGSNQNKDKPDINDQNSFAFEILAPNRYKWNKKYQKLLSEIKHDPDNTTLQSLLQNYQKSAEPENLENKRHQQRHQGKKIVYGNIIQLKHRFTRKWVHVNSILSSLQESKTLAVELHDYNDKTAQFKVKPRFKVKVDGDEVRAGDQIVFESVKHPREFLHVSPQFTDTMSLGKKQRHELNLSSECSGFHVLRKYQPSMEDGSHIKVGDIVRFCHMEMEAYMVAEGLFDDFLTEDGGVLKWQQHCRLLHMCTRMYLCVQQEGQVTLTADHFDSKTLFRFHPVGRAGEDIPEGGKCRLEHVATGSWLHACQDAYQRKQEQTGDSKSMDSLKWSNAQLKRVSAIEEERVEDTFVVQCVDHALIDSLNVVAGIIPIIQKVVADRKDGQIVNKETTGNVICALNELAAFMVVDGEPAKTRQKLLRNLNIIQLIIRLLKCPLNGQDHSEMLQIFQAAYELLYCFLLGGSQKNRLFLARYIDFFMGQFDIREKKTGINAVRVVIEIIRDKKEIVDRITHDHIDRFVDLLKREKNYRYLELLGVLCVCNDTPIADNQHYITEVWLLKEMNCVFLTDLGQYIDKDEGKMYISSNNGKDYILLSEFVKRNEDAMEYLFLINQLKLFGQLCHGQNSFSIQVLTKQMHYFTWKQAFSCVQNVELPDKLRVLYCELIITIFVDIPDNRSGGDIVKNIFVAVDGDMDQLGKMPSFLNQSSSNLVALNKWATSFLSQQKEMTASLVDNNMLISRIFRIMNYLVAFGFYDNPDEKQRLLSNLMRLMDGRNDKPKPTNEGNDGQEILKAFRESGRFEPSTETNAIIEAKYQAMNVLDLIFDSTLSKRREAFVDIFMRIPNVNPSPHFQAKPGMLPELVPMIKDHYILEESSTRVALQQLANIFDKTSNLKDFQIVEILMDLSEYKYGHMISKSMHLLNRYFSAHHSLFGSALHTRVLINKDSVKLHRFLEGKLPELHRLSTSKLGEMEITQLTSILDELIKNSHLKGDKEEPHGINQNIMFSNGVIDECLQIVEQPCEANLEQEQNKSLRKAFKKTFTVLQQLARGHRGIQEYLFDRLDRLLSIAKLPQEMGQTLIEVFIGNARNCKAIEPRHIEKIIKLFMTNKSSANLDLLSVIVKPEVSDVPLKRNQDAFMTYFRKFRAEFASIIELDDSARDAVLTSDNVTSVTSLISLVDLLAICAQGGNSFTTSVCKPIFTILQLLKILNNNSIVDYRKRPFLRFLVWVYVYKPSGQVESGTRTVLDDSTIWSYMENIRGTLKTITDYVKSNPDSVPQLLRRISLSQRDISEDIQGSVRYLFDAVIPFIQIYCQCRLPSGKLSDSTQATTITNLAKDFQEFIKMMSTHCSSQHQIHDLVTCTRVLISRSDFSTDDVKLFEGKYGQGKVVVSATSDALQSYEGEFKDEEAINRQLKAFARNVKSAYEWETSLSSQNEFSSESTYGKTVRDAELPKGPGFQAHMHCFIDEAAHSLHGQYNMSEKLVKQLIHSTKRSNLSAKDQRDQTEVDIKCLQLLRGIILKEIDELPVDFEKCPRLHKHQLTVIKEIQSVLNKFGLICEVVRLVSSANDLVFREALALLETMLFNGNEEVQTSLIEYFSERKDDTFFLVFQRRISMSSGAIKYSFAQRCLAQNLERTMTVPVEILESDGISSTFSNNVSRNNKVAPTFIPTQENQRKEESKLSFTTDTIPQDIMDDGCFAMVLNVLRLMCSNQNSRLQDLLREQPESSTSINLVAETSGVVGFLYENISTDSIHLLTRVFETLADLSSCNRGNLKVVFESHVCANANHILQVGMYGECTHREIFLLKQSIGMLLRCLTEENRHGIKEHENESVEVMQCLDVGDLIKTMTEAWKAFNTPADESLVPLVQSVGFLFYHLIARKMERHNDSTVLEDIKDEEVKKALEYYESHSMSIEIVKNDVVQKIYFRVKDKSVLRKEVKDKFKKEIDRSSQTSKIQGLVEWSNDIANDIINRRRISINPFGRLLIKLWTPLNYLVMLFTLAIAVVIMVTWKVDANQPRINAGYRWQGGEIAIYALGGVHNFLSLAILLSYIVSNRPRLPYTGKVFRLFRNDETLEDRQYRSRLEVKIYDWKTIYYVIFLGCSVAGTVTDGYLFAIHFLHIVEMNAHLKRVLKSITTNAKSLLLVALLGLAILYIYALILYAFYRDWKWSADNGRHCTTIYECFVSILHHGLVESPYAQFEGNMTDNFKEAIGIMFFDVSFFIIITLLGFYIILGIIVDTFIQLRNSRGRIEDDLKTVCFICGRKCTDFGLHEKDFTKHIKIEHNLWAYILFFIHLDETNRQEYSPLERYVFMKLIKNELDFFPVHRAPSLEMADAGKTVERHNDPIDHVIPTVKRLEKQMEFLVTRMKDKEEELSNKKSKKRPKTETKP